MSAWQWFFFGLGLILIVSAPKIFRVFQKAWRGFWEDFNRINNHGEDDIDVITP